MKKYVFFFLLAILCFVCGCKADKNIANETQEPSSDVYVDIISDDGTLKPFVTPSVTKTPEVSPTPTAVVTPLPTEKQSALNTPFATENNKETGAPKITPTKTPKITECPEETKKPEQLKKDYSATEYKEGETMVRDKIEYERKTPVNSLVQVENGKLITVIPDIETGYYYTTEDTLYSDETYDYLENQSSSNSLSRNHSPERIIGRGYLEKTPFFYLPLIGSSISKHGDYDRVVIGNISYDKGNILAACYSYPKKTASKVPGVDKNTLYIEAVYLDTEISLACEEIMSTPEDMMLKQEYHQNIIVSRPVSDDLRSDYTFLAYPLLNGMYIINCGGGLIVLNNQPNETIDIRFSSGGGIAGFVNFQLFFDGDLIFECDRFCINSYEGDCTCFY